MNLRPLLLRVLDTVEAAAIATVGACLLIRGFILDEPVRPKPKRDPFTGLPEDRPN